MVIKLSFKQDEEWLYQYIKSHSSFSGWIKDLIKKEYAKENQENNHQSGNLNANNKSVFNLLD